MTKAELIEFLEPFADDIKIMRFGLDSRPEEAMLVGVQPSYEIGRVDTEPASSPPIDRGEGYILMR